MKNIFVKLNSILRKIRLVDKFLILIMTILLMQSAYALFFQETTSENANSIDTIVRTSAAAIFGYFISSNFINKETDDPDNEAQTTANCNKIQTIVISAIGIVSLTLLLISRNFSQLTPQTASTVAQLRDFTSSCVGFLVSYRKK